jgi:outer membrane protein TolC
VKRIGRLAIASLFAAILSTASSTTARADILTRAMFGPDDVGGTPSGPPGQTPPRPPDDLSAWAGTAQPITLPELLQIAVRQSPALATARIDIAIAEARIEQTRSREDWLLNARLSGSRASGFFSGIQIDNSTTVQLTAGVSRLLPTGGSVNIGVSSQYTRTIASIGDNTNWRDEVNFTVTQPLMRGRGSQFFEASERRATLSKDVAVLAKRLAAISAVQAIVSAYWDLVLAERQVAITRASLQLAEERLRITTIGAEGGKIPRSEIPAVRQIIATREEDLLNAELLVLDRSIALRRAAGVPIGAGQLGLRVDADLAVGDATFELASLTERAFAASPELAQLAKQDSIGRLDIEVTENGLLPQLDAALTFGPQGQDENFGTAASNLVQLKSLAIAGSLTYSQGLHRYDVRGRARELREQRRRLEVNAFDIRAQIAQTMSRAVAQLEVAKRRLALSQRVIDLATENIKIENDRFSLGKATNFDVLNRQEELRQAELRRAQAMIDWHKAQTVVMALTGDILPAFGVTVDP